MKNNLHKLWSILLVVVAIVVCGCEERGESYDADYGYVQFRLLKTSQMETSATRATDALDWLSDAHKIKVVMQHDGATITQTLPVTSYDKESAEWGLQSEKLRLMTGDYTIIGYYIYDNLDNEILVGGNSGTFSVTAQGLTIKEVGVPTVERGKISFTLHKALTRSDAEGCYPFESIKAIDITVRHNFTRKSTTFSALATTYHEEFTEGAMDEELYDRNGMTSFMTCGGEEWLEAGDYTITAYTTYSDTKGRNRIETASIADQKREFSIEDNQTTTVDVPIYLSATAEHIKDYEALKEIWLALDGPNWTFHGEEYIAGANWDFNKDIDMWGDQPGVTLGGDGRVVGLNISGFGAKGIVPEAIGQLTELQTLYLGNHNELIGGYSDTATSRISAMDYHNKVLAHNVYEDLSPALRSAYLGTPYDEEPVAQPLDVAFGNLTNGITGISRAVMRLTKLEQLFIANSPITNDFFIEIDEESPYYDEWQSWSWSNMELLLDVEIYNCSKLTRLPLELLTGLPKVQSLNVAMNYGISGEQLLSDWNAIIDGASGGELQILYLGYNNLTETPKHEDLKRMVKLGYLDCTNNKLETVHPFGKEISLTSVLFDNNRITKIYAAEDGYFCGLSQLETFSCSNNLLEELPDLFTARSVYAMLTANFSSNRISQLANGDEWSGINTGTLNLADNRFEELPARLVGSGSAIEVLMLSANGLREIEAGALIGPKSYILSTLDLSYNRLTELPDGDFGNENLPNLYGIDISNNAFTEVPDAPLDCPGLTVLSIRHQRDDEGNRTLRTWPKGIGKRCEKLSALYIGSNDLGKVDDVIEPHILLFEIKDNPNISIDVSNVCPYIEKGHYELVYDSTQNITGCDALNLD